MFTNVSNKLIAAKAPFSKPPEPAAEVEEPQKSRRRRHHHQQPQPKEAKEAPPAAAKGKKTQLVKQKHLYKPNRKCSARGYKQEMLCKMLQTGNALQEV